MPTTAELSGTARPVQPSNKATYDDLIDVVNQAYAGVRPSILAIETSTRRIAAAAERIAASLEAFEAMERERASKDEAASGEDLTR